MKKGQESEGARGTAVLSFVLQQVVSTIGALILGVVAVLILATLVAFFTRTPHGSHFNASLGTLCPSVGAHLTP